MPRHPFFLRFGYNLKTGLKLKLKSLSITNEIFFANLYTFIV